ncbi:MAG: hypothetical protein MZU91_04035 [Desulfosudis oleivorans]|nr:hypothetical protein [Desulfosudis oleivorans]
MSYELHPETPPAGMLLSERFKGYDLSSFYEQLRAQGKEVGVVFGNLNSPFQFQISADGL